MYLNLVQYSPVWENKETNKEKLIKLLSGNLIEESVLILPEMTLTGFTMNSSTFAEDLKGESFQFYSKIALENNVHVLGGLIEKENVAYYNTLVHINPLGELLASYRKIHPFSYSSENKFYTAGIKTVITEINGWKTGLSICYDLRFPELFRQYAKKRVELIIVIANWPNTRIGQWKTLLSARAIENQCYVAAVNRVGNHLKLHYNGYSSVHDPMGNEIASLPDLERVISVDISKENVIQVRSKFPFLEDITLI
jgi:predicted amidohydrolase